MAVYYILLPDDTEDGVQYSTNVLGESSFKNFWTDQGFDILERMIYKYPDTLQHLTIKDEQSKEYSVDSFLKIVSTLNLIRN